MPLYNWKCNGGGGGVDLPVGTIAFFPETITDPDWLEAGIYPNASYPDLADLPGYPILDTVTDVDSLQFSRYALPSSSGGVACLTTLSGDKTVCLNLGGYIESTSSVVSGLPVVNGDYFLSGGWSLFLGTSAFMMNRADGLIYATRGQTSLQATLFKFDILNKLYNVEWEANTVIADGKDRRSHSGSRGLEFTFTDDDRLIFPLANNTDGTLDLFISDAGDYFNGQTIVSPITTNTVFTSAMKGMGVSGDKVVICVESDTTTNTHQFWQYDMTNLTWTDISLATGLPLTKDCGCSGHSMSSDTVVMYASVSNVGTIEYTRLVGGTSFTAVKQLIAQVANTTYFRISPVCNGKGMWATINISQNNPPLVSFDYGENFIEFSDGDTTETSTLSWSPQYEVMAIGSDTTNDEVTLYNSFTTASGTDFLVPYLRPVSASSEPVTLARVLS